MKDFLRKFFFPYLSGAACTLEAGCDEPDFPQTTESCLCTTAAGGINELYFIPCTEVFTEANVTNVAWWQDLVTAGTLGKSGLGLGSIGKKSQRNERVASCRTEQLTGITWALRFVIKCMDKTSARSTHAKVNELIAKADKYLLVARMCDGDNDILPVGLFDLSDMNWTVPDNSEESQTVEFEASWKELGLPVPVTVAGLSSVVPKLK